jgi:hypothetical protein
MQTDAQHIITATIPEFRRLSGISRSRIYELLDAGEIESVYIGARRLIVVDSYRGLIERQREVHRQKPSSRASDTAREHARALAAS